MGGFAENPNVHFTYGYRASILTPIPLMTSLEVRTAVAGPHRGGIERLKLRPGLLALCTAVFAGQ